MIFMANTSYPFQIKHYASLMQVKCGGVECRWGGVALFIVIDSTYKIFFFYFFSLLYIWPRGYKTFFMLNSAEHKILNAYK